MADVREVSPDLVGAPGDQVHLQQRQPIGLRKDPVFGQNLLGLSEGGLLIENLHQILPAVLQQIPG